jgi:hypothetical protein
MPCTPRTRADSSGIPGHSAHSRLITISWSTSVLHFQILPEGLLKSFYRICELNLRSDRIALLQKGSAEVVSAIYSLSSAFHFCGKTLSSSYPGSIEIAAWPSCREFLLTRRNGVLRSTSKSRPANQLVGALQGQACVWSNETEVRTYYKAPYRGPDKNANRLSAARGSGQSLHSAQEAGVHTAVVSLQNARY